MVVAADRDQYFVDTIIMKPRAHLADVEQNLSINRFNSPISRPFVPVTCHRKALLDVRSNGEDTSADRL